MTHENLPQWLQPLLQPSAYDHAVAEVKLVQTHISFVLLAGDYVYKFKKPVNFGFLDFSTLGKRKHCCEQELLLNRRLCPSIYLGLVQVNQDGDSYQLAETGEAQEYGIKMLRMPEDKMMANVIAAGVLDRTHIDAIVAKLAPFYEQAERSEEIDEFGQAKAVAVNVLENFEQTEGFIGGGALEQAQFDRFSTYAKEVLAREELFKARIASGHIRDCHGDLYSANICLADAVYIYDCIEFNRRFRYCDVASDVAFLAMDLDFHDLPALSEYFIDSFIEKSGDPALRDLLNFYKCYRAYVRGKINLFTAADPAVDAAVKENCIGMAGRYFRLADSYCS